MKLVDANVFISKTFAPCITKIDLKNHLLLYQNFSMFILFLTIITQSILYLNVHLFASLCLFV